MTTVGAHEAKTHLSRLLERVAAGEEVSVTNRGTVVARLVGPPAGTPPASSSCRRTTGTPSTASSSPRRGRRG